MNLTTTAADRIDRILDDRARLDAHDALTGDLLADQAVGLAGAVYDVLVGLGIDPLLAADAIDVLDDAGLFDA